MKKEDHKDGMPVTVKGNLRGYGVELEKCNDGSHVIHVAFIGKECQWRVPIDEVEKGHKPK